MPETDKTLKQRVFDLEDTILTIEHVSSALIMLSESHACSHVINTVNLLANTLGPAVDKLKTDLYGQSKALSDTSQEAA